MHCMILLLDGTKVIHFKDSDIYVNTQEICFLTQHNYFMSEKISEYLNYKSLIIYFDDTFVFELIKKYKINTDTTDAQNVVTLNTSKDKLLQSNISLLQNYLDKKLNPHLVQLKIEEILLHALRIDNKGFLSFLHAVLSTSQDRIKFILESNIDLIQNIDDMSKLTRLTPNKLRNYIKKEYNTTPKLWLDTRRLEKAKLMLSKTNKSITNIASECGYATVSWFISQFKKHCKQTPKEFRHKM